MDENIDYYYARAKLACEKENFDYAIKLLEHILSHKPEFQEAHHLLYFALRKGIETGAFGKKNLFTKIKALFFKIKGDLLSIQKKYLQSGLSYEKAFIFQPKILSFLNKAGSQFLKANLIPLAISIFEEISKHYPNYIPALNSLARIYLQQGELEKALQIYERLHELLPSDLEIKKQLQYLHTNQIIKKDFIS